MASGWKNWGRGAASWGAQVIVAAAITTATLTATGLAKFQGGIIVDAADDAVAGDADAGADDLIIGNNSAATATGQTFLTTAAGVAKIAFGDDGDADVGRIEYDHAANDMGLWCGGAEQATVTDGTLVPTTDSDVSLGTTGLRWSNFFSDAATIGGNLTLGSASPTATFGDGTGTPEVNIIKSDAGQAILDFQGGSGGAGVYWRFSSDASEDLVLERRHNDAWQSDALKVATASGDITISSQLTVGSYLTVFVTNDAGRGAAGTAGRVIFNTTDGQLNIDDGANWTLPDGTTT